MARPEARARTIIDRALTKAGWVVQDEDEMNLAAARGVAVREVRMAKGYGQADYLLFVDREAVGALEAKKKGHTLSGVERQVEKYSLGLPDYLETGVAPLPFQYLSTGTETLFVNGLDPRPRSRQVFAPHRPETLADWLRATSLERWVQEIRPAAADEVREPPVDPYDARPASLRGRLASIPPTLIPGLWDNQQRAINGLEASLAEDRPRALVQMATGSGKSLTAVVEAYRLIKLGGARRILFLVDRGNLGSQAQGEFETYRTYDDHRKLTDLYNVQRLTSNVITDSSIPPEFFDVIFIDECHRSIYTVWRQVLEYFDAFLIGLTATPARHTYGFSTRIW